MATHAYIIAISEFQARFNHYIYADLNIIMIRALSIKNHIVKMGKLQKPGKFGVCHIFLTLSN